MQKQFGFPHGEDMEDLNIPTENDDNEENEEVLEGGEEVSDAPTDEEKAVAASMSPTSSISATQRLQSESRCCVAML